MRDEQHAMGTDEIVAMATRSLLQVVLIYRQGSALHRQPASPLICPFMHSLRTRKIEATSQCQETMDGLRWQCFSHSLSHFFRKTFRRRYTEAINTPRAPRDRQTDRQIGVSVQIN